MFLLRKFFDLREKAHPGHEKPFLEHLEDFRRLVTRIVLTLLVAMGTCFAFQSKLLDFLRGPVDQLWQTQQEGRLPGSAAAGAKPLDLETWEQAKVVARASARLDPSQRAAFHQALNNPELVFHAETVSLLSSAKAVTGKQRANFLASLDDRLDHRRQIEALLESDASTEIDPRGNLRLMSALRPTETFMLSMKLSFFAGIIFSFPLLLMYILQFVLPGLDDLRRRVLWPAIGIGFGLFLGGAAFAYFGVLPRALLFFQEWSERLNVSNDWRIGEYISFALNFTLLFGLAFELPVIVMVLVKMGLLDYELMSRTRNYAITAIFILAAIMTPPDPFTLLVLALPMVLLYEICIWLTWLQTKKDLERSSPA